MEKELERILDAIEPARRRGRRWSASWSGAVSRRSAGARSAALPRALHLLPCAPGRLILEDADGEEDQVTPSASGGKPCRRDRGVPLVVLAGCSTALEGAEEARRDRAAPARLRPGAGRAWRAERDRNAGAGERSYATDARGRPVPGLATWQEPEPLHALAEARRRLERQRLQDTSPRSSPEWPTPALYAANGPLATYDPTGHSRS